MTAKQSVSKEPIRRRRIGVCGSSKGLPREAIPFCQVVGECLARHSHIVIASGGTKQRRLARAGDFAVDWHIVQAAQAAIPPERLARRVETYALLDEDSSKVFSAGKPVRPRGNTGEARRFSFVHNMEGLIAVAGRGGTGQELALAAELSIPVLPVPTFAGEAREHWRAYRSEIVRALRIDDETASRWESMRTRDEDALKHLAAEMVEVFLNSLRWRCFVIMPFHHALPGLFETIAAAVNQEGDDWLRIDREHLVGDAPLHIRDGIAACDYAIAVLDGLRHNVLYELGLAHGQDRPVILVGREGELSAEGVPFDIAGQQRIEYAEPDTALLHRLRKTIARLHRRESAAGQLPPLAADMPP